VVRTNAIDLPGQCRYGTKISQKTSFSYQLYDETMQIKQEYQHNILWSKKLKEAIEDKKFCLSLSADF
jgi:c-di-GMP phosphodiesterase